MSCIPWCENSFLITLKNAKLLISPFCDASFLTQRNENTMAHVLLVLIHLVKHIQDSCSDIFKSRVLLLDIEISWKREENSVFLLAFDLHLSFNKSTVAILSESLKKNGNRNNASNPLSVARLAHAAVFYYEMKELHPSGSTEAERNKERRRLDKQLIRWISGTINLAFSMYEGDRKEYMVE